MSEKSEKPDGQLNPKALLRTLKRPEAQGVPELGPIEVARPFPVDGPDLGPLSEVVPEPADAMTLTALSAGSVVAEEFRLLIAKLRVLNEERRVRSLGVVSAVAGEGKTTLSLGLAAALARQPGRRVLLVEADLRRPAIERYLGLPGSPGVAEWLRGGISEIPVRRVIPAGFYMITAGQSELQRPELLGSGRMAALFETVRRGFHYVVADCPPLTPIADSVVLQDFLDGFLLVVRAEASPRDAVVRAVAQLRPGRVLGTVFNDQREVLARYLSSYYRRYRQ
jgi:capsular exopolysaccharide synthesis family protein